jgi:acetylornithine deacetylase/succinyl-diaminopimelate desuccinylase-like protein
MQRRYVWENAHLCRWLPIVPTVRAHTIEEANAHSADERLPLSNLRKAMAVVALALVESLAKP